MIMFLISVQDKVEMLFRLLKNLGEYMKKMSTLATYYIGYLVYCYVNCIHLTFMVIYFTLITGKDIF